MNHNLAQLILDLRSGEKDLLAYLEEVAYYFGQREPDVLAFMPEDGRFSRLKRDALALLEKYPNPEQRPPLFGVPVGVKDIFRVDGFATGAGSKLPTAEFDGDEAPCVTALKDAGALILGKTVTTEFAYFGPGPTHNPHRAGHTPGGSSSGSAAAVGARLSPLTLGTQTIGSINRPASYCGVVGFKPSYDRIDKSNVIPLSGSFDHIGMFTPSVSGLAAVAAVMCADWQPKAAERKPVIAIPEGPYLDHADELMVAHMREVGQRLTAAGYTVQSIDVMADFDEINRRHQILMAADAAGVHAEWYAKYGDIYHPKTVELIERGRKHMAADEVDGTDRRLAFRDELHRIMDGEGIDIWLSPAAPGAAPAGLSSTGNPIMNLPWTQAGLPNVNLPTGWTADGLPLGMQFTGRFWQDEELLAWAAEIEGALSQ